MIADKKGVRNNTSELAQKFATKAYKSFIGCNTFQIHFHSMIKGYDTGQLFFAMNENADIPFWSMV